MKRASTSRSSSSKNASCTDAIGEIPRPVVLDPSREHIAERIWQPPSKLPSAAWVWWFWLFFFHDEHTLRTGKCRQLMILWSTKADRYIRCNTLDIFIKTPIQHLDSCFILDGAAAAWYFDGTTMHENFVLEKSNIILDPSRRRLDAPGKTPSSCAYQDGSYITTIDAHGSTFELRATQVDDHPSIGPTYGNSFFGPFQVEGIKIERLLLTGTEQTKDGERKPLWGTAYFQKILLAAPPPQWYWGMYHFEDGSYFSYMQSFVGRAAAIDNLWEHKTLKRPTFSLTQNVMFYHAPSKRFYQGNRLEVTPSPSSTSECWIHHCEGGGKDFSISARAEGYARTCWKFTKQFGILPFRSNFCYNEYPAVLHELTCTLSSGKTIRERNGWGNMENSWGIMI